MEVSADWRVHLEAAGVAVMEAVAWVGLAEVETVAPEVEPLVVYLKKIQGEWI